MRLFDNRFHHHWWYWIRCRYLRWWRIVHNHIPSGTRSDGVLLRHRRIFRGRGCVQRNRDNHRWADLTPRHGRWRKWRERDSILHTLYHIARCHAILSWWEHYVLCSSYTYMPTYYCSQHIFEWNYRPVWRRVMKFVSSIIIPFVSHIELQPSDTRKNEETKDIVNAACS